MQERAIFHDSLYRLAQIGDTTGVRLVRVVEVIQHNRYRGRAVEFASGGGLQFADDGTISVTNLAEPADRAGQIPAGTDAVSIDVEGRWVVFLKPDPPAPAAPCFPAKVVASLGQAAYSVREQVCTGEGLFANKPSAPLLTACNLAELSLGPGAALDDDMIVLAMPIADSADPQTVRYVFDHPAYAKYLD